MKRLAISAAAALALAGCAVAKPTPPEPVVKPVIILPPPAQHALVPRRLSKRDLKILSGVEQRLDAIKNRLDAINPPDPAPNDQDFSPSGRGP